MGMFRHDIRLRIEAVFYIALALAILVLPIQWVVSWLIAAAVHELGHFFAILACKRKVFSVTVGCRGAIMETEPLERDEWKCALAGPACGLALLVISPWFPRIAICGAVQSVFNLMPITTMDGGRILLGLLRHCLPDRLAEKTASAVSGLFLFLFSAAGVILTAVYKMGILPLLLSVGLSSKFIKIKFPCKDGPLRVQ